MVSLAHEVAALNTQECQDENKVVNQILTDPKESAKFLIVEGSDDVLSTDEELVVRDRLDNSLTDSKYIIIRHANSSFNYMMSNLPEHGVQIDGEIHPKEIESVTDIDHLDAKLSEVGVMQALDHAEIADLIPSFTTVLVSPLRRALETAYLLFKNTSYFDSLNFVVVPLLRENLHTVCDIPQDFQITLDEYSEKLPNLDSSLLEENYPMSDWFVQDL
jgi:hypothetical protein